ncbi:YbdK family carboxylate-amine ligase [Aquincola tertiaricarbonis]|uniref:Putative glutamate--cysteine ligase 2 n=1 Tax=Aquincola tertiaricarbonis TaxID=391953 RepID=A0ABY4SIH4_AQUTE|nr:YbdK family carboxylate-amine ligase [Aquincola tertiaricarbonis]URI10791.1 YbdK family carboxylate-amine ligase [Aquincola tertiaricarbonis]
MSLEAFASSRAFTMGVELELQIVNRHDYDLTNGAADLLRVMERHKLEADVKPEITSSMIETSTGICERHHDVITQLSDVRDALVDSAGQLNLRLCGGGTHAFQDWSQRRIVDTPRYLQVSQLYGYLSKQFTVFGQHVHIGCPSPDDALWLLHALSRYVPHVIALSASSPYIQGSDTGYESSRLNTVSAFPLSGRAPFMLKWSEFEHFFSKMEHTGVVKSMKDFYWDIRPKPEFGTIEVRVMDVPLTVEKAAAIAVYLQCVARWLLTEKPFEPQDDDYLVYSYNRFQACRFGLDGEVVDPRTAEHKPLRQLIAQTLQQVEMHAIELRAEKGLLLLRDQLTRDQPSDAGWLRATQQREQYLPEVVRQQCMRFEGVRTPGR